MIALPDFVCGGFPIQIIFCCWKLMDFGLETSNDTVKMATGNRALHQLRLVVFFLQFFLGRFYTSQVVQDVFHQQ